MGEPVSLEREYACCVTLLAFDQSPMVFCRVFSNDVFHKLLVTLSVYLLGFFLMILYLSQSLALFVVLASLHARYFRRYCLFRLLLKIHSHERTRTRTHTRHSHERTRTRTHTRHSTSGLVLAYQLSLGFVNPPRRESDSRGVVSLLPTVTTPFCLCIPVNPVTQKSVRPDQFLAAKVGPVHWRISSRKREGYPRGLSRQQQLRCAVTVE